MFYKRQQIVDVYCGANNHLSPPNDTKDLQTLVQLLIVHKGLWKISRKNTTKNTTMEGRQHVRGEQWPIYCCSWKLGMYTWRCSSCSQPWIDTWIHDVHVFVMNSFAFLCHRGDRTHLSDLWQVFHKCNVGYWWWINIRFYLLLNITWAIMTHISCMELP